MYSNNNESLRLFSSSWRSTTSERWGSVSLSSLGDEIVCELKEANKGEYDNFHSEKEIEQCKSDFTLDQRIKFQRQKSIARRKELQKERREKSIFRRSAAIEKNLPSIEKQQVISRTA
mmetsp:Transcript_15945/g.19148  ORF Transcript_15945/g.19148 Transcript_15945/m.19148 type:complete len:118 (-) Transcript_15945:172-525(-)